MEGRIQYEFLWQDEGGPAGRKRERENYVLILLFLPEKSLQKSKVRKV